MDILISIAHFFEFKSFNEGIKVKFLFINTQLSTKEANILNSQFFYKSKVLKKLGVASFYFGVDNPDFKDFDYSYLNEIYGFKSYEIFFKLSSRGFISLFKTTFSLRKDLKKSLEFNDVDFIYFRNCIDFLILNSLAKRKNIKIIYDSRSILFFEVRAKKGISNYFKSLLIRMVENYAIKKTDYLFTVSKNMTEWISKDLNRRSDLIIPCTCDTSIFTPINTVKIIQREDIGWSKSDIVLVYSGGLGHWQRVADTINLFSNLSKLNIRYKLLFLTNDVKEAENLFNKYEVTSESYLIKKVPHLEVSNWLRIADFSLVLRSDDFLNFVASPVKIAEYLACGLPVIYTNNIGDYSELIFNFEAGILYEESAEKLHEIILNKLPCHNTMSHNALHLSRSFSKDVEMMLMDDFLKGIKNESN